MLTLASIKVNWFLQKILYKAVY